MVSDILGIDLSRKSTKTSQTCYLPPAGHRAVYPGRPGAPAGGGAASLGWRCTSSPSRCGAGLALHRRHPQSWENNQSEASLVISTFLFICIHLHTFLHLLFYLLDLSWSCFCFGFSVVSLSSWVSCFWFLPVKLYSCLLSLLFDFYFRPCGFLILEILTKYAVPFFKKNQTQLFSWRAELCSRLLWRTFF